jgi:O-antigen/teichoic acid export membrane protein
MYRRVAFSMLGVCGVAVILAYPVLSIWISSTFAHEAIPIVWILCIGIWFNSIASVPYVVLQARGNPRLTALFHVSELVFYIAVFWVLALNFGLIGAALAWLFRVVLDWLLLHYSVQRLYLAN